MLPIMVINDLRASFSGLSSTPGSSIPVSDKQIQPSPLLHLSTTLCDDHGPRVHSRLTDCAFPSHPDAVTVRAVGAKLQIYNTTSALR